MKRSTATLILLACLIPAPNHDNVFADELSEQNPLTWTKVFEPISVAESADKLIMLVVTNDDPFSTNARDKSRSLW